LACTATGFTAGLAATGLPATGLATALGAVLGAVLLGTVLAATFEAVAFEPAAFAEVLAVLLGIALLLFFEDFAAVALVALRGSLREEALLGEALARLLVALRLTAAALLEPLEALFLRVFCDTACARNRRAPVRCFTGTPGGLKPAQQDLVVQCAYNSTFSVKINGLCPIPARLRPLAGQNTG
jgi:uncharacterized protein (DUF2062 family)